MLRPKKIAWPIGIDELLRLGFPKKRIEDRYKFHRLMVADNLIGKLGRKPTEKEVLKALEEAKSRHYDSESARYMLQYFRAALPVFAKQLRQQRARAAALAKWKKT
jgi:hypothetical protein